MADAINWGHFDCVQLLSSYRASRSLGGTLGYGIPTAGGTMNGGIFTANTAHTAEELATHRGKPAIAAWLEHSRDWSTPLHHLEIVTAARARALLRAGADLAASRTAGGPTPLSLARELDEKGEAPAGSAAALVLLAAAPWGPSTHALWPAPARSHAAALLHLGHQLSRRFEAANGQAMVDCWLGFVMPFALTRGDGAD